MNFLTRNINDWERLSKKGITSFISCNYFVFTVKCNYGGAEMIIKTRKQGNSVMITVPSEFNIGEGIVVEPELKDNGIFYKFISPSDNEIDFSIQLLKELVEEGIEGSELIKEFQKRKSLIPKLLLNIAEETMEKGSVMSKEELRNEIGL